MTRRLPFLLRFGVPALLLAAGTALAAASSGPADDQSGQIDRSLQAQKEDALDIKSQLLSVEQALLYPDATRTVIYVSVPIAGLLIRSISVSVDNTKPFEYNYNDLEAIALQRRGMQPLLKLNAAAGGHRIRANVVARFADAQPNEPQIVGQIDASFTKGREPAELELSLTRESSVSRPILKMRQWVAEK